MIDEYRHALPAEDVRSTLEGGRDWLLTVIMFPFFLPGWVVGLLVRFVKIAIGAVVTGFRYGYRSLGNE